MKVQLLNTDEFILVNNLKPVTSHVMMQRGNIAHPEGLFSTQIFGMTPKDRKETFAYIDLGHIFFHPHIYKIIKRFFRNVEKIVDGSSFYTINSEGHLVLSDEIHGETGVQFLYDNWEKIKWEYTDSPARNERIDVVMKSKKAEVFMSKLIVIPPFYRDVTSSSGGGKVPEINNFYVNAIRLASILKENDVFNFNLYSSQAAIQNLIVDCYDYFKEKLQSKNGLLRKYLMGKNVDLCTRTVITATSFHANKPEDMQVNFRYTGIPIAQVLSLAHPFVMNWVKGFFERELMNDSQKNLIDTKTGKVISLVEMENPELVFTDKFLKKKMDSYIKDPDTRFKPIEIPLKNGKTSYLIFHGTRYDMKNKDELATIANRKMTWTDVFYMACEDIIKDKHVIVTRYPLIDQYGLFVSRIRVLSTSKTIPMQVGEKVYPFYPDIDLNLPDSKVPTLFIDSVRFSNSYLPGLDGDYDGDQTTMKIMWSQEANDECERVMNRPSFFVRMDGSLVRFVEIEAIQTFYNMTKNPNKSNKSLNVSEIHNLTKLTPDDITFDKLVELFGHTEHPDGYYPKYNPEDTMTIPVGTYCNNKEPIDTTIGRFIFNKGLIEKSGMVNILGYINTEMTEGAFLGGVERTIATALLEGRITTDQMYVYVDTRDWMSLQGHVLVTPSFTPATIKIHPEVEKLKKELFKKYEKELASGDATIAAEIEKQLIAKTKEVFKDDIGMDLYNSGARGSLGNNYKNIALMRGAVYNRATGQYEVVQNSLNDGLAIKDIPISSNTILEGAYPKACGTRDSGYISKKLLAECQTEFLGDKDSDCQTKRGIKMELTEDNYKNYMYRYIMVMGKPVLLTSDNIKKYVGKVVELRTPMTCVKTQKGEICNICGGDFYYMLDNKAIGLSASRIGNALTKYNMKKFHDNVIKFTEVDLDDILI